MTIWLVVWNMAFIFPYIYIYIYGNVIIPTDEVIFFRGVGQLPTSQDIQAIAARTEGFSGREPRTMWMALKFLRWIIMFPKESGHQILTLVKNYLYTLNFHKCPRCSLSSAFWSHGWVCPGLVRWWGADISILTRDALFEFLDDWIIVLRNRMVAINNTPLMSTDELNSSSVSVGTFQHISIYFNCCTRNQW